MSVGIIGTANAGTICSMSRRPGCTARTAESGNMVSNTVYIPGVGDFLTRPTGHPHDPTTPEQEDEISSAIEVTSEVRALLREADDAIVRRDMVGFRAAMQVTQEYLSGMKF